MGIAFILYCSGNNDKENIFMCPVQMEVFAFYFWLVAFMGGEPTGLESGLHNAVSLQAAVLLISGKGFSDVK